MFSSRTLIVAALIALLALPGAISGLNVPVSYMVAANYAAISILLLTWFSKRKNLPRITPLFIGCLFFSVLYISAIATASLPPVFRDVQFYTWLFCLLSLGLAFALTITVKRNIADPVEAIGSALHQALLLLCLAQVVLYFIGVEHAEKANFPQANIAASIPQALGITFKRAAFPIASSLQVSALYPSLLLASSLIGLRRSRLHLASALLAFAMLVMIDTRSMLAAPFLAVITLMAISRLPIVAAAAAGAAIPAVPVAMAIMSGISAPIVHMIFPERDGGGEMFTGRSRIWGQYFSSIDNMSAWEFIFGYGGYGQFTSGINRGFSNFFSSFSFESKFLVTMHNMYVQIVVDLGLFGLVLFVTLMFCLVRKLLEAVRLGASTSARSALVMLLTILWTSGTEVIFAPYVREGFVVLTLLWMMTAFYEPSGIVARKSVVRRLASTKPHARPV